MAEDEDHTVSLSPVLGVSPHVYVPIAWLAILAGVVLALSLTPRSANFGTTLNVTSNVAGASIAVDGTIRAATPGTVFVPAGERDVRIALAGSGETITYRSRGRRLLGRVLPRTDSLHVVLNPDPDALGRAVEEHAAWALGSAPSAAFQQPWTLSETARALSGAIPPRVDAAIAHAALVHARPWQAGDLIGAALRVGSEGGALGPLALAAATDGMIRLARSSQLAAGAALGLVASGTAAEPWSAPFLESDWASSWGDNRNTEALRISVALDEGAGPRVAPAASPDWVVVEGGAYILNYPARDSQRRAVPVVVPTTVVGRTEVTNGAFARFVTANPAWAPTARAELVRAGLADEYYLLGWGGSPTEPLPAGAADEPVTRVSWYAANAYVDWLNASSDATTVGRFVLPSRTTWEYVAYWSDAVGLPGVTALSGGVWEWTADWHSSVDGATPEFGAERMVIGGSERSDQGPAVLGAFPPSWTSAEIGFRVFAVPAGGDDG